MKGRDFIFTGIQPWDLSIGSNARDIATQVSLHNRVLYVNTPLGWHLRQPLESAADQQRMGVIRGKRPSLRQMGERLWVLDFPFKVWPINFLPDGPLFDWVNRLANRRMYLYVRKILRELNFENYILFTDNDIYRSFYAKEYLRPAQAIYYRRDNMVSPYWKKHAPRLEPLLCGKSDLVVANSAHLALMVHPHNANTHDIGQGLDLSGYSLETTYKTPSDVVSIPHPVVGYTGWITSRRLDAALLYEVARALPHYSFVMVGSEDELFQQHPLHTLNNVYFLGAKPFSEIPAYIASFDVCLNPQLVNDTTIGNYPRKIDEYLAMGKPVVATQTETMTMFAPYVYNCLGVQAYIAAIKTASSETKTEHPDPKAEERALFAQSHTWENSVNKLYSHIK